MKSVLDRFRNVLQRGEWRCDLPHEEPSWQQSQATREPLLPNRQLNQVPEEEDPNVRDAYAELQEAIHVDATSLQHLFIKCKKVIRREVVFLSGSRDADALSVLIDDLKFHFSGETCIHGCALHKQYFITLKRRPTCKGRRPIPLRLLRDGDGRPCERTMQPGCLYYDTMASGMKDTWQVQPLSRISVTEWKLWVAELESVDEKERTALGAEPSPNVGKTEQRERDGDAEREARRRILCRQTSRIHLVPDSCPSALPNWSVEELERSLHLSAQERHLFTIRNQVMLSRQHWDVAFMERFEGLLQMSTMRNVAERRTSWWRKMIGILSGEPAPDLDIDSWDYYSMLGRPSSGKQKKKERERMELAYRSRLLERSSLAWAPLPALLRAPKESALLATDSLCRDATALLVSFQNEQEELVVGACDTARWDQLKAHGRLALNAKKDVKE
eukprot:gene14001-16550_t